MSNPRKSRNRLKWGSAAAAIAVVLSLTGAPARAATAQLPGPARAPHANATQTLQAPLIDSVAPADSGTVTVAVTPGDTAQEAISRIDVSAFTLDDQGNPVGNPVTTGSAGPSSHGNPAEVTLHGLTNDVVYGFVATEITASGAVSAASPAYDGGPQTPQPPLAPTLNTILGRDGAILAAWNPADPDGSPVTGYTVTATPRNPADSPVTVTVDGTTTITTITGLINAEPYTISVAAANAAGTGPTGKSDSTTVGAAADGTVTPQPAYAASAPTDVSAAPPPANADGSLPDPTSLEVAWDPPIDDGGSPIDAYTVIATATGQPTVSTTVPASTTRATLTGLTQGTTYSVTVIGTQHNGMVSSTSSPVTAAAGLLTASGTVILSAASVAAITRVTPTSVVFTSPPAQVTSLAAGNIIVAQQTTNPLVPDGLLLRVDQTSTAGGVTTLTTSQAPLPEAFQGLDFTATGNDKTSGSEGGLAIHMLNPAFQARVLPQATLSGEKTFTLDIGERINKDPKMKDKLGKNTTVTANLTAALSLTSNWEASLDYSEGFSWYSPSTWSKYTYHFSSTATVKASVKGNLGIAYKTETEKQALLTVKPSPTGCLMVSVVALCPTLTVYTQTSVDGSISFSFSASYERTIGAKISRDSAGKEIKENLTKDPVSSFNYNLTAAAKVTFSFPVELKILFYNIAGPRLVVTPALMLAADTSANPWLKVTAPLKVEVFFDLDFKVKTFTFGGTVYDNTFPVYSSPGAFPVPYLSGGTKAASPAVVSKPLNPASITPIQYAIHWPANCDPAEAVTWSMAPGSVGTVSSTGLYTPPSPLPGFDFNDLIDATTAGSTNCPPVTAQAAVHFGGSTPESPSSAAISPDGTTVNWTAPADDGGSPIQQYIVTVLGDPSDPAGADTVLGTVPGTVTSLAIPADRIPQVEEDNAKVAVIAVNDRGQSRPSEDSPVAPATDPMTTMTATAQGTAGAGTITVTPSLLNLGEADATDVTFQLTYPAVFTGPALPSYCTNNAATDVITCDPGAIASGAFLPTPIQFSLGQMTVGTGYPVTVTRTSASPYPKDPDNGVWTLSCVANATLTVTCH